MPGQKGTPLLCDNNNYSYRIHMKNKAGTQASYRCVKCDKAKCPAVAVLHVASSRIIHIMNENSHETNILEETARQEEKKMIAAAAQVGRISNLEVMTTIKTNQGHSDVPEATSNMTKSKALTQAINWEKKNVLGHGGIIPKTGVDIMDNLPEFRTTSTGTLFLHYTVLKANHIQITLVSDWKRARTKTLFVITKIACEFHNSATFTQRSDIVSCIWSSVFCI